MHLFVFILKHIKFGGSAEWLGKWGTGLGAVREGGSLMLLLCFVHVCLKILVRSVLTY